jgi:hypothetical protein
MRLTAEVSIIGGGLPVFPGAVAVHVEASLPALSVSMLGARNGAKKLRVVICLGGVLTGSDVAVGTAFLEVGAASLVLCRLRLRTLGNLHPELASQWIFL